MFNPPCLLIDNRQNFWGFIRAAHAPMTPLNTYYENLQVSRDASQEEIQLAYCRLAERLSVVRNPGNAEVARALRLVEEAFFHLSDGARRAEHDRWIRLRENGGTTRWRPAEMTLPASPWLRGWWRVKRHWRAARRALSSFGGWCFRRWRALLVGVFVVFATALIWSQWDWINGAIPPADMPYAERPSGYERSPLAPNGRPWPESAGYLAGYPVHAKGGYATYTIDNTNWGYDLHLRLYRIEDGSKELVRQAYLPKRQKFTFRGLQAGHYQLHFRDLDSGRAYYFKAEPFLKTRQLDGSEVYQGWIQEMAPIINGNNPTHPLPAKGF